MTTLDLNKLESRTILLWGSGGGYDIYAGFFLYKMLSKKNKVHLGNYSFSDDLYKYGDNEDQVIVEITGNETLTSKNYYYFPEYYLAKALHITIYTGRLYGPDKLIPNLDHLISKLAIDYIILIDAGHDALLFGDEGETRGTPFEDMSSIVSFLGTNNDIEKILCCISVPTENIPMELFYKHLSEMESSNGFLGKYIPDTQYVIEYESILNMTNENTRSIPNECLLASMKKYYGKHYRNPRLEKRMEIDDCSETDYPNVTFETKVHWLFHLDILKNTSPLISYLYANGQFLDNIGFNQLINQYYHNQKNLIFN